MRKRVSSAFEVFLAAVGTMRTDDESERRCERHFERSTKFALKRSFGIRIRPVP